MLDFVLATICALLTSGLGDAEAGWSAPRPPLFHFRDFHGPTLVVSAEESDADPEGPSESSEAWGESASEEENEEEDSSLEQGPADPRAGLSQWLRSHPARLSRPSRPFASAPTPKFLSILRC